MSKRQAILAALPPFKNQRDSVIQDQSTRDLVNGVLVAHERFATDYDVILRYFPEDLDDLCRELFHFTQSLPYKEESKDDQTTRSPAGILTLPFTIGTCDCKHYAGFIAGILDAHNRHRQPVEWYYRFCTYEPNSSRYTHVYVIVIADDGSEIWLDPAPIGCLKRQYNDRYTIPEKFSDKTVTMYSTMSGARMNAVEQTAFTYNYDQGGGYESEAYPRPQLPSDQPGDFYPTTPEVNQPTSSVDVIDLDQTYNDPITQTPVTTPLPDNDGNFIKDFVLRNPVLALVIVGVLGWAIHDLVKPKRGR